MNGSQPGRRTRRYCRPAPLDLLLELLAIPGPSGQEAAVADCVCRHLLAAGARPAWIHRDAAHRRTRIAGQTGNLVLRLPGTQPGPRRLLLAHLDTVPICVGCRPVRRGRQIRAADPGTALGADNRAGTAVVLSTALTLLQQDLPRPPLTFLWTVQEEVGLQGARHLRLGLLGRPPLAFNWDGGDAAKVTIGATGGYRMEILIEGKASHAGNAPEKGVNAITVAALAIAALQRDGWHGRIVQDAGEGTSNVGVIAGGTATNVVPDRVQVWAEARSHQPSFRRRIVRQIEQAFRRAARDVRSASGDSARVRITGRLDYESFCLPTDHPCVQAATGAIRALGREPQLAVANGGLDANWLTARGIPTVSLGCGQMHPHTLDEALDVDQFAEACRLALHLATAAEHHDATG